MIAIFALGDPVIGLGVRDNEIGWNKEQRHSRLYNVYDAFVLGAVEPYRQLLAGKLVALLAISSETRRYITNKYTGTTTGISKQVKDPTPALITTSSALGKSSIYNRLTFECRKAYYPVGYTSGFGHFHISEEMFQQLVLLTRATDNEQLGTFGEGANYRFRVIRQALSLLDLPANGLRHGVRREVFLAPVAHNWREYLRGEADQIDPIEMHSDDIATYYRDRWAVARAERKPEYQSWRKSNMKLSNQLPSANIQFSLTSAFDSAKLIPSAPTTEWKVGAVLLSSHGEMEVTSGESIGGIHGKGVSRRTEVAYQNVQLTLSDTQWDTGERDVQATDRSTSPARVDSLVRRLRIGVYPSPLHEQLVFMELRAALPDEHGRAVVRKITLQNFEALLGYPLSHLLPRARGIIIGTRAELFKDESRRRTELCALFQRADVQTPATIWVLTRLLPFLATPTGNTQATASSALPRSRRAKPVTKLQSSVKAKKAGPKQSQRQTPEKKSR